MRLFSILLAVLVFSSLQADEGMWLYNNLPVKKIADTYGFQITDEWKDHLMKSSVRFPNGSGSIISSNGLVLTNHHVAAGSLQKISTQQKDYYKEQFLARTLDAEIPIKDLSLIQLVSIEDVTARVNAAVKPGASVADASSARTAVIAEIEKESSDKTQLRSEVMALYQGGQYHLYRYKVYKDVRLVFSPEFQIAFFGGDPDNFEFPRYNLDMCIFRLYENGKPAKTEDFFKWSTKGVTQGDLVFVSGHPGTTNRMFSTAALEFLRDVSFEYDIDRLLRRETVLSLYRQISDEHSRQAQSDFFSTQNTRKARLGMLKGLQEQSFLDKKGQAETLLRAQIASSPEGETWSGAWERLKGAQKAHAKIFKQRALLEMGHGFDSRLFQIARGLVRLAAEDQKPNSVRLPAYRDSGRASLLQALLSPAPIYPELEIALFSHSLSRFAAEFGYEHPLVKAVLNGRSAARAAEEIIHGTLVGQLPVRQFYIKNGKNEISRSRDPMIQLVLAVDKAARAVEKKYQETVAEVEKQAYAQVSKALFAEYGTSVYPDATFTLRLAYGQVKGYSLFDGHYTDHVTTLGGAFAHETNHGGKFPWQLPESWKQAKAKMDLNIPFNFVSTADIIGGNSGSPVLNKEGELVGLIFDGNIESLTANYMYDSKISRAVAVHSTGIWEAMKTVYQANELLNEIGK